MLEAVSLSYKNKNLLLLDNIHITFTSGCLYSILGANGSGKTTLLRCLSGLWAATSGSVFWNKKHLFHQTERREASRIISMVPQEIKLSFDLPVRDFVWMGRYSHGRLYHTIDESLLEQVLKKVDAILFKDRLMSELSYGERQRIFLARALITEAPVLLLDEPAANLDIRQKERLWNLLSTLRCEGKIVIVANHDLEPARQFSDYVVFLQAGRVAGFGRPETMLRKEMIDQVFG